MLLRADESDGREPPGGGGASTLLGFALGFVIGGEARLEPVDTAFHEEEEDDGGMLLLAPFVKAGFRGTEPDPLKDPV